MEEKTKKRFSVRKKMYIFVAFTIIVSALGTAAIAFFTSANRIDNYYKQAASDNAKNMASFVDGDFLAKLRSAAETEEFQAIRDAAEEADDEEPVIEYLKEHGLWDEYYSIRHMLTEYIENVEDIKYLYLTAHGDRNADHDMYLIDDESTEIYETGYYEERELELRGIDLTAMNEPMISRGDWGWLCSAFYPVYDSNGNCVCVAGCDFGMDDVMAQRYQLLAYIIIGSVLFTAAVMVGAVLFINKVVVKPLRAMTHEMKRFEPSEHLSYEDAGVIDLSISSRDEINEIYEGIRSMQINIVDYLKDVSLLQKDKLKAQIEIEDKDKQIDQLSIKTYKDALTGVGNKAAYIKKADDLNKSIAQGNAEFALVRADINNLKQINDDDGHRAGDAYIKGCCDMICDAFKHSPVFRIGGDEFITVLQGKDYADRKTLINKLRTEYEKTSANDAVDPWLRFSAAVGIAEYASDDNTVEFVFKRADQLMYKNKAAFKKEHGGYR